jgi:hypothetical protein
MTSEQLQKAIEFVKGGGQLSAIEAKYDITAAQRKQLTN